MMVRWPLKNDIVRKLGGAEWKKNENAVKMKKGVSASNILREEPVILCIDGKTLYSATLEGLLVFTPWCSNSHSHWNDNTFHQELDSILYFAHCISNQSVWDHPYRAEPPFFQLLLLSGDFQSCGPASPLSCALPRPPPWKNHRKARGFLLHLSQRSASGGLENIKQFIRLGILDTGRLFF